jgi:mannan endo-1,4-beta-mannosidase
MVSFFLREGSGISNLNFVDDDGFTIYLDDAEAKPLVYDHVKKVEKLNKK